MDALRNKGYHFIVCLPEILVTERKPAQVRPSLGQTDCFPHLLENLVKYRNSVFCIPVLQALAQQHIAGPGV